MLSHDACSFAVCALSPVPSPDPDLGISGRETGAFPPPEFCSSRREREGEHDHGQRTIQKDAAKLSFGICDTNLALAVKHFNRRGAYMALSQQHYERMHCVSSCHDISLIAASS